MYNLFKNFLASMNMATWTVQGSASKRLSKWSEIDWFISMHRHARKGATMLSKKNNVKKGGAVMTDLYESLPELDSDKNAVGVSPLAYVLFSLGK